MILHPDWDPVPGPLIITHYLANRVLIIRSCRNMDVDRVQMPLLRRLVYAFLSLSCINFQISINLILFFPYVGA